MIVQIGFQLKPYHLICNMEANPMSAFLLGAVVMTKQEGEGRTLLTPLLMQLLMGTSISRKFEPASRAIHLYIKRVGMFEIHFSSIPQYIEDPRCLRVLNGICDN